MCQTVHIQSYSTEAVGRGCPCCPFHFGPVQEKTLPFEGPHQQRWPLAESHLKIQAIGNRGRPYVPPGDPYVPRRAWSVGAHPLLPGLPTKLIVAVATIWIRKNTSVPSQKPIVAEVHCAELGSRKQSVVFPGELGRPVLG